MPRPSSRPDDRRGTSRRGLLGAVAAGVAGIGIAVNVVEPAAYTIGSAGRDSTVNIAGDTNGALLGLLVSDSVKKNSQSLLCEITNNAGQTLALDVSLDDPTQGTLYGPNGSGSTVSLTLADGATDSVDLESGEPDGTTVPFTISRPRGAYTFDINRQTTVKSGNTSGEVSIDKLTKFRKDSSADEWTIKTLEVSSTNYDLDTVELTVEEKASGDTVGTKDYEKINSKQFVRDGKPGITIQPDASGYDVQKGITYVLTVKATDKDGNFARKQVQSK